MYFWLGQRKLRLSYSFFFVWFTYHFLLEFESIFSSFNDNNKKKINDIKELFQSFLGFSGNVRIVLLECLVSRIFGILFFIYCKHLKTETYVVEQKTRDLLIFCNNWLYPRTIFTMPTQSLNYDFERIQHGQV